MFALQYRKRCRLTLEEVDSLVSDEITRKILRQVYTANDASAVEISAFEQLQEAWPLVGGLHLNDTAHHGDSLSRLHLRPASKSLDRVRCFFESSMSD